MSTWDQLTSTGQGFQKGSRLPASPQTLQQAQDPEAEGALASAPSLAEGGALESLGGGRATLCAPEHMCLRTRWSAHACMCACLEGGGKFSLQV